MFFLLFFSKSGILSYFVFLLGFYGSWILSFPLIEVSEVFFLLFLQGIPCLFGYSLDTLAPCPDIIERLELPLLISISLGCSILVLLSEKLADEIDLYLFSVFNVSSVSVIWVDLDLSNELDLSNDPPLSDSFLMDLSFLLLDYCGLSVFFTV